MEPSAASAASTPRAASPTSVPNPPPPPTRSFARSTGSMLLAMLAGLGLLLGLLMLASIASRHAFPPSDLQLFKLIWDAGMLLELATVLLHGFPVLGALPSCS